MNLKETRVNTKNIFSGKVVKLNLDTVCLPDGNYATREVINHIGGCCIVALDTNRNIYMVNQYRYPVSKQLLEIPAGKLEPDEHHASTAARELLEETGIIAGQFDYLGYMYPCVGYSNEVIHIYLATDLSFHTQNTDEDEFINVTRLPFEDALKKAAAGEIEDSKTVVALMRAKYFLDFLDKEKK